MNVFFTIIFLIFSFAVYAQEQPSEQAEELLLDPAAPLGDLEEEPHARVHGVNVITGDYTEEVVDISLGSVERLQLQRSYSSSKKRKNSRSTPFLGWEFNHHGSLTDSSQHSMHQYEFQDERGQRLIFRRAKKEGQGYPFRMDPYLFAFSKGYMHFPNPGATAPHPFTTQLICHKNLAESLLISGSGDRYQFVKEPLNKIYFLEKIKRANGLKVTYTYNNKRQLVQADLRNLKDEVTHSLFWNWNQGALTVESSEGQSVTYTWTKQQLEVSSPMAPTLRYLYNKEGKVVRREGPGAQILEIEYDGHGRVKELKEPVGRAGKLETIYCFRYGKNKTQVFDAQGVQTLYHYGDDQRLISIEHCDEKEKRKARESFFWTFDGELVTRAFEDGDGNLLFIRSYTYDGRGNVANEAIYGNLTGKNSKAPALDKRGLPKENGCEVYRKQYRYSKPRNLLLEESEGNSTTRYEYPSDSSLLAAQYLYEGEKMRLRYFYEYDQNGALALEIVDDGNKEKAENISHVTERHVTRIKNRQRAPIGLPKEVEEYAYDLSQNKEILTRAVHNHYDDLGHLIEQNHFDSLRQKAYTLSWVYDAHGNCVRETDAMGQQTRYAYDESGNLIRKQGPDQELVQEFAYDAANRLIQEETIADGERLTKQHVYDKRGQIASTKDIYGHKTRFTYDAFGRVTETHFPGATSEKRSYNALGHLMAETHADGSVTRFVRNIRGQPVEILHPDGSREFFEFTVEGRLDNKTSQAGSTTYFLYDYQGRCVREENRSKTYNGFHLISKTDCAGAVTTYEYDSAGRLATIKDGEKETHYSYDAFGRCRSTVQNGIEKGQQYDLLDRLIEENCGDERVQYAYDAGGRRTHVITSEGCSTTLHNAKGDIVALIDAEGNKTATRYVYDYINSKGERVAYVETTSPDGSKSIAIQDIRGRVACLERQNQRKVFDYDPLGRMILSQIEGDGQVATTTWQYDAAGHLVTLNEDAKSTHYTYNEAGLRESVLKADGVKLHYSYDDKGRLASLKASDGTIHYRYEYDAYDNVSLVEDVVHGLKKRKLFDRHGRCIQETLGNGLTLKTSYDALDRKTHLTLPDGSSVRYIYESLQLETVERLTPDGQISYSHTYFKNGAKLIGKAGDLRVTRDHNGRPTAIDSPYWKAAYRYDPAGNLLQRRIGESETLYQYDLLGQLCEEQNIHYQYDGFYNRLNDEDYSYDQVGRLISRNFEGRTQMYTYDALDRLIRVTEGTAHYEYIYDDEGRRLSKRRQGQETVHYLYSGHNEIGSYVKNIPTELRLLGVGLGAEIGAAIAIELGSNVYAPVHDLSGNLVSLIASDTGELAGIAAYTAFGVVLEGLDGPWGFASKRRDPETGFVYFGQRFYDPHIGRWITPDPLGVEGGPNLYAYLLNNPLTHFDCEGLFLESIGAFVNDSVSFLGYSFSFIGDHLLPVPYLRDAFSSIGRFLTGSQAINRARSHNSDLGRSEIAPGVRIVAVNGILNNSEDARNFSENLSNHFGGNNVHYCYNSSHGFIMDLLECAAQKLGFHTHSDEKLTQVIREQCQQVGKGGEVHLVAHSQGGLVTSSALAHLSQEHRSMLHVYTIGSASVINPEGLAQAHNYINSGDPIPWLTDPGGIVRHWNSVHILHSPLFDHPVLSSPSYQRVLSQLGKQFITTMRREP